ncbi:hypothetical protein M8494_03130 [Serratia ureilytica]
MRNHPQTLLPCRFIAIGTVRRRRKITGVRKTIRRSTSASSARLARLQFPDHRRQPTSEVRLIDANQPRGLAVRRGRKQREYYLITTAASSYLRSNHQIRTLGLYRTAAAGKALADAGSAAGAARVELQPVPRLAGGAGARQRAGAAAANQLGRQTERAIPFDDASYMAWLGWQPRSRTAIGCATAIFGDDHADPHL